MEKRGGISRIKMGPEQPQKYEQEKEPENIPDSEEHMEKLIADAELHLKGYQITSKYKITPDGIVDSEGKLIISHKHDNLELE